MRVESDQIRRGKDQTRFTKKIIKNQALDSIAVLIFGIVYSFIDRDVEAKNCYATAVTFVIYSSSTSAV